MRIITLMLSAPFKIHNIGKNAPVALIKFIETIEKALEKVPEKSMLPIQDGNVVATYADTKLADGIGKFVKWYRKLYL